MLCASVCCPEDNDFANQISIENNTIISIENNANTFNIDDTIYIERIIENSQITTNGQNVLLSDYFYLDLPETVLLRYSINLSKDSGFGNRTSIPIDNEFIEILEGNVISDTSQSFPNLEVNSFYNGTHFRSKFGIQLKERGTFYLSSVSALDSRNNSIIISGGEYNKGFIDISTKIVNADADGFYKFVVN